MGLTPKQRAFADHYIITGNATEAAIQAGYSKKTATAIGAQNLTKLYIVEYIEKKLDELSDDRIAKADEVLEYLTRVMRREEEETVVNVLTRKVSKYVRGKKVTIEESYTEETKIPTRVSDANKAAELLGKRHRLFVDKIEMDANTLVQFVDDVPKEGQAHDDESETAAE